MANNKFQNNERILNILRRIIRVAVRALAFLMVLVILLGVLDVVLILCYKFTLYMEKPVLLLSERPILELFGSFMVVLIAIEIFVNIIVYLRDDVIQVKIVMATALMAIARKIIILDYKATEAMLVWGMAALLLALSIGYWLVFFHTDRDRNHGELADHPDYDRDPDQLV